MFAVITKREYWAWLDQGFADPQRLDLKGVQDAYVLSRTADLRGKRILEVGGGNSRVLRALSAPERGNECWNADRFEGVGNGPVVNSNDGLIRHADCYVGAFSELLPENYFDVVFSVSVIEHIALADLEAFFADTARVLRPGGVVIHAIDLYLLDEGAAHPAVASARARLRAYRAFGDRGDLGLAFAAAPELEEECSFKCAYATNSDVAMNRWNQIAPALRAVREQAQSVSIAAEWLKASVPASRHAASTVVQERAGS